MALNIKDPHTERLAAEVAALAHETKTGAIRVALAERLDRLRSAAPPRQRSGLRAFLLAEVWPQIPAGVRGVAVSRAEREDLLGYTDAGV